MPSPYNLRTRSSTSVSPVKRERATVKKTKKPKTESEKDEKNSLTGDRKIQNVEQVPNVIVEALLQLQIESLDDLAQLNLDDLQVSVEKLITTVQDQPTNQSLLVETMRRKIIKAWMGYLVSLSKDGIVNGDWRKFLEMTSEGEKNVSKPPLEGLQGEDAEAFEAAWTALQAIRPLELLKQRQALKKCGPPKGSEKITFDKLREGKSKLVRIPTGEAISDAVNEEILVETKESLRKVDCEK